MKSKITSVITKDLNIRAMAIDSTELVERARQIHNTSPVVTAALGRTLSAVSMMGYMLKGKNESVTLQIKGDGPIGTILTISDEMGNVRGYAQNSNIELPLNALNKLDVGRAVGEGNLIVIKDLNLKEPYIGQVPLVSGEIAEDITHYFAISEQIPTVCALGVLVNTDYSVLAAGGYLIQLMPYCENDIITKLEENVKNVRPVSAMIHEQRTNEEILKEVLRGFEIEILEERQVSYLCNCTAERVERAMISIGANDLDEMIKANQNIEVTCQFCDKTYSFTPQDLSLLKEKTVK
jgi:molecular chaperone Hsp33